MKTLYFVQHGLALPEEVDPNRPLSETGFEENNKVATYLKNHNIEIHKIFHSGKLRAMETAAQFSEVLGVHYVSKISGMNPNDSPTLLIKQITEDAVMYVGHLPNIDNIVATLLTHGGMNSVLHFQNSAVACIEVDGKNVSLKWFITASMC
ncbi:MAG: phosphohistidine phosphatase [Psychromonas sp.]|jgi:phosphohistidine phosphatase|uniref:phosphohistidine phosphatase SixA n=1 Tax=Psychromonas sp. TaxID=1884585 RepID=UPI0039E5E5F3